MLNKYIYFLLNEFSLVSPMKTMSLLCNTCASSPQPGFVFPEGKEYTHDTAVPTLVKHPTYEGN